jgi:hypothetical protein
MADTVVAAGASKKMMSASALSRLTASAAIKRSVIDVTIQVRDTYASVREIEFLKAEIAAFMDRLETISRVSMETRPLAVPDGNVTVSMKIVHNP